MQASDDADIIRILNQHNPWWTIGKVPDFLAPSFRRRDFYFLKDTLDSKEIIGIIGARRVGKSTLMYQLIQHLLERIEPSRIIFLKIDDPYLEIDESGIKRIFELYSVHILKSTLDKLDQKIFIFLDEIQSLTNWGLFLKRWFDLGYKIKFVISGSSSAAIRQESMEILAGRFHPQIVCPMKFLEVVRYKENETDINRKYDAVNWGLRGALSSSIREVKPEFIYKAFSDANIQFAGERDQLLVYLQQYLMKGGYPEVVLTEDIYRIIDILRNYLDQTIYRDIVRTFLIRDPKSFESLFTVLAGECCQRLNYSSILRELGIRKETLRGYLFYLEYSFLITESKFYSKSRRSQEKKDKKIYINDIGLRNSVLGYLDPGIVRNTQQIGFIVENVVADHCRRLKFNMEHGLDSSIYYWNDKRGHEVDVVIELFQKPIPIEIKYQEDIARSELTGLYEFMEKYNSPLGFVVTKNTFKIEENIIYVPVWLFLFLC